MAKYKVLFITSRLIPPQSILLNHVARSKEVELHVLLDSDERDALPGGVQLDTSLIKKNVCSGFAIPVFSEPGIFYNVDLRLIGYLVKNEYDLYILGGYHLFSSHIAYLISIIYSRPYILFSETHAHSCHPKNKKVGLKGTVINKIINRASSFIAVSSWAKDYLVDLGAKSDDIFVIPYLPEINQNRFNNAFERRPVSKRKLGISPDSFVLLWVGRMIQRKRVDLLLQACHNLKNTATIELFLVGSGHEEQNLRNLRDELDLERVHFVGAKNHFELEDYYNSADLFVYPSEYEPFGAVVTEALSYGLPVISTDCVASAADFISNGQNGFIVSGTEAEKISDVIFDLANNQDLYTNIRMTAGESMKNYSNHDNADKLIRAINHGVQRS